MWESNAVTGVDSIVVSGAVFEARAGGGVHAGCWIVGGGVVDLSLWVVGRDFDELCLL